MPRRPVLELFSAWSAIATMVAIGGRAMLPLEYTLAAMGNCLAISVMGPLILSSGAPLDGSPLEQHRANLALHALPLVLVLFAIAAKDAPRPDASTAWEAHRTLWCFDGAWLLVPSVEGARGVRKVRIVYAVEWTRAWMALVMVAQVACTRCVAALLLT